MDSCLQICVLSIPFPVAHNVYIYMGMEALQERNALKSYFWTVIFLYGTQKGWKSETTAFQASVTPVASGQRGKRKYVWVVSNS